MPLLKRIAHTALHRAGGLHVIRSLNRNSLRILMFHSFLPWRPGLRQRLERRCAHLKRFYHPVSLGEAAHAWRTGAPLPANALAITADDGYRDFFEIAYPVFAAYRIPATVYLVGDFMDGKLWLWTDQLRYAIDHARGRTFDIALPSGESVAIHLETRDGRERAVSTLSEAAKQMPDTGRRRFLSGLPGMLELRIPEEPPGQYAPLTWESVKQMASDGIEFGAHTRTHPILSRLESDAALCDEIEGSKRRIEEELGRPVLHFCYPNGRPQDIGDRVVEFVKRAGYETAVVTAEGFNFRSADRFALKRIPADPAYSDTFFQEYVAGVRVR